ncbi:hypothetical protein HDV00_000173 [Rhizophlyctis rosea]|nr:hypothetical protein HDV00_000173 [Rhizophlyctis rosea]
MDEQDTTQTSRKGATDDGFAMPSIPLTARKAQGPPPRAPEQLQETDKRKPQAPPLNYEVPEWSAEPSDEYFFEVRKCSRSCLPKRTYKQLRVGDMIRFGESTRFYIFQGPAPEEEEEPKFIPPPLRPKPVEAEETEVSWGFGEDATEDDEVGAPTQPDEGYADDGDESAFYHADPKKALRNWLEQRGSELHFTVEEEGHGRTKGFVAKVELPIEVGFGTLTGVGRGSRKKAAENEAALDACKKLDRKDLLRNSDGAQARSFEKAKLKKMFGEVDDDDDSFYDRTEKKGNRAKQKTSNGQNQTETFESLTKKREDVVRQIEDIHKRIEDVDNTPADSGGADAGDDELDEYMQVIEQSKRDERKKALRRQLPDLEKVGVDLLFKLRHGARADFDVQELARLDKLLKIVAPTGVALSLMQPVKRQPVRPAAPKPSPATKVVQPADASVPEVEEEDEEEDETDGRNPAQTTKPTPEPPEPSRKRKDEAESSNGNGSHSASTQDTTQAGHDSGGSGGPQAKRRKVYGVMTAQQAEEHWKVESEDAVEWIAPDDRISEKELKKLNAAYGY